MMPLHKHYIGPIVDTGPESARYWLCKVASNVPIWCRYISTYTGPILGLNRPNIGCVMADSNVPVGVRYNSVNRHC